MKKLILVIAFLLFSSTAWGQFIDIAGGIAEGLSQGIQQAQEMNYRQQQIDIEQQLVIQEQQRINMEQQLLLQQQWQLIQQQQQQLSQIQLEQQKRLRLLQKQQSLQRRQEFIRLYLLTPDTIDSSSGKHTVFATKFSNIFHKSDCSKLNASKSLLEIDTSQQASKAGYLPCNYCRP